MHSHQRMTQFIRKRENGINQMQGGRDAGQQITEQQAKDAGLINFLRGGKMFGGETIINRIRMFTYRISTGNNIMDFILLVLLLAIIYMRVTTGSFDFITNFKFPGQTVKPVQKFEFF